MIKLLIIIFIILLITCVSFIKVENFNDQEIDEEISDDEISDEDNDLYVKDIYKGKYQQLDDTLGYLNNYKSNLYNNLGFFSNNVNNLLKESPVNKMKLVSDSPASSNNNQTFFETLEYKKALIDATKMQDFEDIYLYKMNQLIN
jgi:hypothetical protein